MGKAQVGLFILKSLCLKHSFTTNPLQKEIIPYLLLIQQLKYCHSENIQMLKTCPLF